MHEGQNKINRIGLIHNYRMAPYKNSAKEILSRILKIDMKGTPDTAHFKIAMKHPSSDAVVNPAKKSDYKNTILTITSEKTEEESYNPPDSINMSIDYQRYYEPVRTLKDVSFSKHLTEAQDYIRKNIKETVLNFESTPISDG